MKRLLIFLRENWRAIIVNGAFILGCLLFLAYIFFSIRDAKRSYDEEIYREGYSDGYCEAKDEGQSSYDDGYADGYADGSSDGYYDGAVYTCLFFGDVDRAFQSALNGGSWFVFVDAYDQYIENIYDDEDAASELGWALVGVTSENGASTEEIDLLITTFGKDIFLKNNISLTNTQ